jgi:type III pantothenate kinase
MVPRLAPYDRHVVIAIDVGNSAVKVAHVAQGEVRDVTRLPTAQGPRVDALARLLEGAGTVALVSVVPAWSAAIEELDSVTHRSLLVATHETIPLPVEGPDPSTVGADRLLGAWSAVGLVGSPCIVVDVGTATTIDVVDGRGAFVGGAILPGPALGVRALARGTALLPPVPLAPTRRSIGRDTIEAIASGVMLGQRDAIGGLIARMTHELATDRQPRVVLTGGDASVLGEPEWADRIEPDLLLRGLAALVEHLPVGQHVGPGA